MGEWSRADGSLQLFSLRVREEPAASNSLVTLVSAITERLGTSGEALGLFDDKLAMAGYFAEHAERYAEMRFRIVSEELYRVEPPFPRLSASLFIDGLPSGVERVEYEINLGGCSSVLLAATPNEFTPPPREA
jgi:hypothetical protein